MRTSQTAVLERGADLRQQLETEPFETAWAGEARWFVQFPHPVPEYSVSCQVQVSPDGLVWTDHETPTVTVAATGLATIPVHDFGGWLRLSLRAGGDRGNDTEPVQVKIVLTLKE